MTIGDREKHTVGAPTPIRLLGSLVLLVVVCCGGQTKDARSVVRVGWAGHPDSLNPGVGLLSESYVLYGLVYDSMFELALDHTYAPSLAASWEVAADGREWTFELMPGSFFHDGQPVTAADVKFSYDLYRDHPEFPFLHGYTQHFERVEAVGERTVVLRLDHALPNLPSQLLYLYILPEHVWRDHAADPSVFGNRELVGSGPFRLLDVRGDEYVRLAAHRSHPRSAPLIDEVIFVTYGTLDAAVQAVRTGEVDLITELPLTAVEALQRDPAVRVAVGEPMTPKVIDLKLNQAGPEVCPANGGVCSGHPALRDLRVRRALAFATPKQELIDVVMLGFAAPGRTLVAEGFGAYYNDRLVDYPYDIEKARALLTEAGFVDHDGDGVRELPGTNEPLVLRFFFPSDSASAPRAAELVARSWARLGVRLERRAVDPSALGSARAPALDYDVILWSWDSDPDPSFLLSVMTSSEIKNGGNDTGWSNAEYDELFLRQATAASQEERRDAIWRMQEIALQEVVYIVPYYERMVQAYRTDRFRGWRVNSPGLMLEDRSSLPFLEPMSTVNTP